MKYTEPNPKEVEDRAKYFLEALTEEKPGHLESDKWNETVGLLYLTGSYGLDISDKLKDPDSDGNPRVDAMKYLNSASGDHGISGEGP